MLKTLAPKDGHLFILSIVALVALILDFGFPDKYWHHLITDFYYWIHGWVILWYIYSNPNAAVVRNRESARIYVIVSIVVVLAIVAIVNTILFVFFQDKQLNFFTALLVFLLSMFDLSRRLARLDKQSLHPALVFVISFLILIFLGTLLLMLPNSTPDGISFIDALFTSTSAVCVTGLAVRDTGQEFTRLGQLAILFLIQFGALGMLSFTSLFGLLFKGFGTFQNRLNLKNLINADSLQTTFKTLVQILVFVFAVEIIGAVAIYSTMEGQQLINVDRWFFSFFHSISAFCNAGFSTLSNSLYESNVRYNYSLHLIIAFLIILGGIGYGVVINVYEYMKRLIAYLIYRIFKITLIRVKIKPVLTLNTKIVLITTVFLILFGWVTFYFLELNNTMTEHSGFGKLVTSFFGSVTTRTAGFNSIDTGALTEPFLLIVLFLMWVGASPGSTGGGIKTTTFAVAILNIVQQAFGLKYIRVGWRKIDQGALQRATSIISLSLIVIGISTFLVVWFDRHLGLLEIMFECVSAFSTVGLSMGITSQLSPASKVVIIVTMFIGRVGFLTLISGIVRQISKYRFKPIDYPEEKILIN